MSPQIILPYIYTLLLGSAGAFVASYLGLPAPYLVGPSACVTLGGLLGLRLAVPVLLRNAAFLSVGLSMGSGVTPEVLQAAAAWPASFAMVLVTTVLLLFVAYRILRNVFHYDGVTAMLAACPGHLSYVLSLAAGMKSDLPSVGIIQSVRVLALTLLVPLIVEVNGLATSETLGLPTAVGPLPLLLMALPAAILGFGLLRLRVPAALLVGGMLVSSFAHLGGLVSGPIPQWLQIPVYVVLGSMIGTRFSGVALADLRRALVAGIAVTVLAGSVSASMALLVSTALDVPLAAALIAFAPGGLETMAAMAVIMHADPAYVGTHHILRLVFLSVLMPLVLARRSRS
ncbi:AbrB family transcriptional regulator [Rhizobium sp. SAFR-030]|uniref:AbrB family transcriptional regulator n=1 Tax=Rhizobium sp. SAFR-030 TaxID=3387277 RepID=UPI003F7EAF9A